MPPLRISDDPASIDGSWWINACRDGSNEDWYLIAASQLRFDLATDFDGVALMRLTVEITDTGVTEDECEC